MGYSYAQLEGFWEQAGGPANVAPIMAAIADAESGGSDVIQKNQPYATTGWGLWQITPGNSVPSAGVDNALLDPLNNAKAAVAKYHSQGLGAWTTYNTGAYKQFMQGNTVPSYTGDPGISQANATTGVQSSLGSTVLGWIMQGLGISDVKDMAERLALMLLGAVILVIGLLKASGQGPKIVNMAGDKAKSALQAKDQATDTASTAADESAKGAEAATEAESATLAEEAAVLA